MKWAHVKYDIDGSLGQVPFSFIEHSTTEEVCENSRRYVFWSSDCNITPEGLLKKQGKIAYVDKIKRSTNKNPRRISGYYLAIILRIKDSLNELYESLSAERVKATSVTSSLKTDTFEDIKELSVKQESKSKQRNVALLLKKCGIENLTAIVPNSKTDITNTSDEEKENYISSKTQDTEVTKLHEKNMDYVQTIELLKKEASQSEEHWKKKYNDVEQQNEELIKKNTLLIDLNIKLQVQLNSLRKEIPSDAVKNITYNNPINIKEGVVLSSIDDNNYEIIGNQSTNNCIISIVNEEKMSEIFEQQNSFNTIDKVNNPINDPLDDLSNDDAFDKSEIDSQSRKIKLISREQFLAANKNLSDGKNHDSRFIKTLSELEWTKNEMEKRTAKRSKNCNALPMCSPEKVDYLKIFLDKRMDSEKVPPDTKEREKRKLEVANYLCDKFSTVRRDKKRRQQENKEN